MRNRNSTLLCHLFFTHGGSHINSSGIDDVYISNPQLAQHAIVVTHNYRLNALVFWLILNLQPKMLQTMAMAHLKQGSFDTLMHELSVRECRGFGGNPRNIMILGNLLEYQLRVLY